MLVYVFALRGPGNPTNPANPYNPWVVGATQGEAVYALRLPPAGARIRLEIAGGSCLAALGLGHGPRAFTATGITSVTGYVLPRPQALPRSRATSFHGLRPYLGHGPRPSTASGLTWCSGCVQPGPGSCPAFCNICGRHAGHSGVWVTIGFYAGSYQCAVVAVAAKELCLRVAPHSHKG